MINPIEIEQLQSIDLRVPPDKSDGANQLAGMRGAYKWPTLGDLHGNALKLIHFLRLEDIITIPDEKYLAFVNVYDECHIDREATLRLEYQNAIAQGEDKEACKKRAKEALKQDEAKRVAASKILMREILPHMRVSSGANIRLLGDVLGDRGANDLLTLQLIEKVVDGGVNVEIILSNHDSLFIQWMEAKLKGQDLEPWKYMGAGQADSLKRLNELLVLNVVTLDYLKGLYDKYKQTLKLLSYDYNEKGQLILHSHAHLDERDVLFMANGLLDNYAHKIPDPIKTKLITLCQRLNQNEEEMISEDDTKALIDHINAIVQYCASDEQMCLSELIHLNKDKLAGTQHSGSNIDPSINPVHFAIWNRDDLDTRDLHDRPKNPNIINIHGHSTYDNGQQHAVCLDNSHGKADSSQRYVGTLTYGRTLPVNVLELRYMQMMDMMQFLVSRGNMVIDDQNGRRSFISPASENNPLVNTLCMHIMTCFSEINEGDHLSSHAARIHTTWTRIDHLITQESNPSLLKKMQREWNDKATERSAGPKATTNQVIDHWSRHKEKHEAIATATVKNNRGSITH